jgi:hypothetical protein
LLLGDAERVFYEVLKKRQKLSMEARGRHGGEDAFLLLDETATTRKRAVKSTAALAVKQKQRARIQQQKKKKRRGNLGRMKGGISGVGVGVGDLTMRNYEEGSLAAGTEMGSASKKRGADFMMDELTSMMAQSKKVHIEDKKNF